MAYSTMSNQANGYLVLSTDWNQLLANDQADAVATVTTAGDIVYATGANALTRLAVGSSGKMLRSTGSAPAWSNITVPQIARLSAQQDFTTTTLGNVTTCVQAINANEVWVIDYKLGLSASSTGGYKFAVTVPASATMDFFGTWFIGTATLNVGQTTTSGTAIAAQNTASALTGWFAGTVWVANSSNAGNIQLQCAENTAAGTSSILLNSGQIAYRIS